LSFQIPVAPTTITVIAATIAVERTSPLSAVVNGTTAKNPMMTRSGWVSRIARPAIAISAGTSPLQSGEWIREGSRESLADVQISDMLQSDCALQLRLPRFALGS